ncbi:uncharacterized protein LOC121367477 [Gigantopelta aegis]|uniref:uncharacterized protein LOC121367477 n=1 Tax=Gigantopelta aegis TaxID=1735272 RepID=UPI001B88E70B|nr:uncharacterized protein LOC121367477 [Gigantopelta aegis]
MKGKLLTVLFLLCSVFQTLNGSGKFEVKLMKYINPGGKGSNGNCCETHFSFWCKGNCDHRFTICVDRNQGSDQMSHCPVGKKNTGEVSDQDNIYHFPSSIGGTPNPIVFRVTTMPSLVRLKFQVVDVDDHNSWDHVDNLIHVITSMNVARSVQNAHFINYEFSARTTLKIGFRSYCDPNYFTKNCSVFCPKPKSGQHYICNKYTGERVCYPGWHGAHCDDDIDECLESPCNNEGACVNFKGGYECQCKDGFGGWHCDNITSRCALDPCKNNGTCVSNNKTDFNCTCAEGWVGGTCEVKFDKCYNAPCKNGGNCTLDQSTSGYHCKCEKYAGSHCEMKLVDFTGPPMTVLLYGTISSNNTRLLDQLRVGLKNILIHLGGYGGYISIKQDTEADKKDNVHITRLKFIAAEDGGKKVIPLDAIKKIFNTNTDDDINQYLPLPLYTGTGYQQRQKASAEEASNWADRHWYVIFLILLAILVVVVVGALFLIRRRRRKANSDYKTAINGVAHPDGNLNVAFENDMYLRMNSANSRTEVGLTQVNDNPLFQGPSPPSTRSAHPDPRPHQMLLNGITASDSTTENPYMEPSKSVEYDTPPRSQLPPQRSHYENSCLDTRETAGSDAKDNCYTDFSNLDGRGEENHYHDLDDVAMEKLTLDEHQAASSDDEEDEITAIKKQIKADNEKEEKEEEEKREG